MMSVAELFLHGIRRQITRITICRVLINNPVILFGDELTGALNTKATIDMMNILTDINQLGTTIMLVTQPAKLLLKQRVALWH